MARWVEPVITHRVAITYQRTAPIWQGLRGISPGEWFITATCSCGEFDEHAPDTRTYDVLMRVKLHFELVAFARRLASGTERAN